MSRQYYDDPYGSSHRRVPIQSYQQPPNNSSRRNVPSVSRDFASPSSFQPNRDRHVYPPPPPPPPPPVRNYREEYPRYDEYQNSPRLSSNRMNDSSNNQQQQRRYRLEVPSTHSNVRHPQSYYDDHGDVSRSSDHPRFKSQQPPPTHYSNSQSNRYNQDSPRYERNPDQYDQRRHREQNYPTQAYPQRSNHQSVDIPVVRQGSNPVRSSDHNPSPARPPRPVNRRSSQPPMAVPFPHPASLLAGLFQGFFGGHMAAFHDNDDDDDDDHQYSASITPVDLVAFAWMMQRPDGHTGPAAIHIQFGDLLDLLGHEDAPSVGLSESDIERIPKMTYRKTSKSKGTDDKCAICLSEYKSGETVKSLRCKHFFHPDCIDPWLKTSTQCPICRAAQTTN